MLYYYNQLGFKYGDSVDVKFSNGYELSDIPYYNGYYVDINEPLLIAYPGPHLIHCVEGKDRTGLRCHDR